MTLTVFFVLLLDFIKDDMVLFSLFACGSSTGYWANLAISDYIYNMFFNTFVSDGNSTKLLFTVIAVYAVW